LVATSRINDNKHYLSDVLFGAGLGTAVGRGFALEYQNQLNDKGINPTSQLSFKLPGNQKRVGWHQDNGYGELSPYNTVTTITALDDADTENGCLWIIPGSHKLGQLKTDIKVTVEWKRKLNEIDMNIDDTEKIPVSMKAGESIMFNCLMLHKSEANSSRRNRRFLFMRYADADAVEVYNDNKPRLGKLLCGSTKYNEVNDFEKNL
jgi:ectoine hydroxylase-related dioxygenase (phytanoyl-CoA dioxygenase family)